MKLVNKKNIYLLSLFVIGLLMTIIIPTYAKFASSYVTTNDIAELKLDFNVNITSVEEYEQFIIGAGESYKFNINVSNASDSALIYYGIWYRMVNPSKKTSDILIGMEEGTNSSTSGSIEALSDATVTIAIMNNTLNDITIDIGVGSSTTNITDIEYLNGRYLITGTIKTPADIMISSIKIDNVTSTSLPTSGLYDMSYTCSKGSQLEWEPYSKSIVYKSGSYIKDSCNLSFTTSTTKKYLNEMPVGSYIAYEGVGGGVGTTHVYCKYNGSSSSSTTTSEVEAPNSCLGQNAREDLDTSGYTYGYCGDEKYKYYVKGWRLAYIDNTSNKAVIVSAGSPECNYKTRSINNELYIKTANALALKYCNLDYVDGNCTCPDSNADGLCDSPSTDAWAINDNDFYNITKAISGVGKRLTSDSSSLGESGGTLGSILYCNASYSYHECGYNNDLIDNGGHYWFAAMSQFNSETGVMWSPNSRRIMDEYDSFIYGLRPVISLSSTVFVTGGNGTINDPYIINK